jgi:hypothetical protein
MATGSGTTSTPSVKRGRVKAPASPKAPASTTVDAPTDVVTRLLAALDDPEIDGAIRKLDLRSAQDLRDRLYDIEKSLNARMRAIRSGSARLG